MDLETIQTYYLINPFEVLKPENIYILWIQKGFKTILAKELAFTHSFIGYSSLLIHLFHKKD